MSLHIIPIYSQTSTWRRGIYIPVFPDLFPSTINVILSESPSWLTAYPPLTHSLYCGRMLPLRHICTNEWSSRAHLSRSFQTTPHIRPTQPSSHVSLSLFLVAYPSVKAPRNSCVSSYPEGGAFIAISDDELSLRRFPLKHAHVRAFLPRSFVRVGERLDPHSSQLESKCVSVRLLI